jgi:hypothetical protein
MVPHFPAIGSGGVPPVPPIILMSGLIMTDRTGQGLHLGEGGTEVDHGRKTVVEYKCEI